MCGAGAIIAHCVEHGMNFMYIVMIMIRHFVVYLAVRITSSAKLQNIVLLFNF